MFQYGNCRIETTLKTMQGKPCRQSFLGIFIDDTIGARQRKYCSQPDNLTNAVPRQIPADETR
jgi:hypothetical protein